MRKLRILVLVLLVFWLVARSDRFLVIDQPQKADVIIVLAGETDKRPARGLELLREGLASKVVLDVPGDARVYHTTYVELAQKWAASSPQSPAITVCPIHGLSTKAEAIESAACARNAGAHSILLVTSDYHTRRARSVFRRRDIGSERHQFGAFRLTPNSASRCWPDGQEPYPATGV